MSRHSIAGRTPSDCAAVGSREIEIDGRRITLTAAQAAALVVLRKRGGEGAVTRSGYVLAAGETIGAAPETWLRLFTFGCIASAGPHRLQLTPGGRAVAAACDRMGGPAADDDDSIEFQREDGR